MLTLSMDSRPHITANLGYKTQLYFIPVFWSNRDRYVMYYALQLHTKYSISPSDFGSKALVPACPPAFRSQGSLGWKISNQGGLALILNKCFQQFVSISIKIFASFSIITFFLLDMCSSAFWASHHTQSFSAKENSLALFPKTWRLWSHKQVWELHLPSIVSQCWATDLWWQRMCLQRDWPRIDGWRLAQIKSFSTLKQSKAKPPPDPKHDPPISCLGPTMCNWIVLWRE